MFLTASQGDQGGGMRMGGGNFVAKQEANLLNIERTRTGQDGQASTTTMKSTEVWKLTDAKTLSVASTRQGPGGEVKTTMVYDKK